MTNTERIEFDQWAADLAAELERINGGGWSYVTPSEPSYWLAGWLVHKTLGKVYVLDVSVAGRVAFDAIHERRVSGVYYAGSPAKGFTASAGRDAAALARRIARSFLPSYLARREEIEAVNIDRAAHENATTETLHQIEREGVYEAASSIFRPGYTDKERRFTLDGLGAFGHVRADGDKVYVELHNLPAELAADIANLIAKAVEAAS